MTDDGERFNIGELPYRDRAYQEMLKLQPEVTGAYREKFKAIWGHEPDSISFASYKDKSQGQQRKPLALPSIGSDEALISYINFPDLNEPLISVGIEVFADGSPYIAEGDDIEGHPEYDIFFGNEMRPFIAHYPDWERLYKLPVGEVVAQIENKRELSDEECQAVVNMVANSIDDIAPREN